MPRYVKRYTKKKMGKRAYRPRKSFYTIAKKAAKSLIETKVKEQGAGGAETEVNVSSAVSYFIDADVSQLAQGTALGARVGANINPVGFRLAYVLHNNSSVPVYARMIVISVPNADITAAGGSILFGNGAQLAPVAENLQDIVFRMNTKRFKVLYDKVHRIAGLGDGTGIETVMRKAYVRLPSTRRTFPQITSSDSHKDNLRFIVICRGADNDTTANVIEMTYEFSYYYKDA